MSPKTVRSTSVFFAIVTGIAIVAALTNLDGGSWDERFLAVSSAIAPWLISLTVVFIGGEILAAMNTRNGAAS